MIAASYDEAAKQVQKIIAAHKTVWEEKTDDEKALLTDQALIWAQRHFGHRASCPSCGSTGLIYGSPIGPVTKRIVEDDIEERQSNLPARFECVACGLKISSYAQLIACKLGDTFTTTSSYSAADYYSQDFLMRYEDDNNEP
jgi:hypothetical protein